MWDARCPGQLQGTQILLVCTTHYVRCDSPSSAVQEDSYSNTYESVNCSLRRLQASLRKDEFV